MTVKDNQCYIQSHVIKMLSMMARDNSRPVLQGMGIKNGVASVADGFMLGQSDFIEQGKEFPDCVINGEDILIAGESKITGGVTIINNNGQFIIEGKHKIITEPILEDYPKVNYLYEAVADKKGFVIALGVPVLKRLIDSCDSVMEYVIRFRFTGTDFNSPVEYWQTGKHGLIQGCFCPDIDNTPWESQKYKQNTESIK